MKWAGFEPGDEPRAVGRFDLAKPDERRHLVPVPPHRALHAFQPPHQRVAGDLEKARVVAESKERAIEEIVAGRVAMPADEVRHLDKARGTRNGGSAVREARSASSLEKSSVLGGPRQQGNGLPPAGCLAPPRRGRPRETPRDRPRRRVERLSRRSVDLSEKVELARVGLRQPFARSEAELISAVGRQSGVTTNGRTASSDCTRR